MCGIVGYIGPRDAIEILLAGLDRLEYRGYDSAGLAVHDGAGLRLRKVAGRVARLRELMGREPVAGSCGMAHTRWATHGAPTDTNAHPHMDCTGHFAVVHNGIIENADLLRAKLEAAGHTFATDTDTEVLAHLIESAAGPALEDRVREALRAVEGTYGIVVLSDAEPDKLVAARRGSPVLVGVGQDEYFVASDPAPLLAHTRSMVTLDDGDLVVITRDGYRVQDGAAQPQARTVDDITWDLEAAELQGYPDFMLKEISEQPETLRQTLRGRISASDGTARLNGLNLTPEDCARLERIVIVACGTSWHAGLVGRHILEELARVHVEVEYASEFRHRRPLGMAGALTIAISQSGETADTLEALRAARAAGSRIGGIVNAVGSTIAREAGGGIYLHAGPEIGVASTKAFTSQLTALLLLGLYLGRFRGMSADEGRAVVADLLTLPDLVARALALRPEIEAAAALFEGAHNALFLGRGLQFPVALEGALKLKEISYLHAEGYPAAEMKHGPLALVDADMPVVFLAPKDDIYPKVVSNMREVKARGGRILAITTEGNGNLSAIAERVLAVPAAPPLLAPIVTVIPLQLLAYQVAVERGCDVDRPRHLAKSVTVE